VGIEEMVVSPSLLTTVWNSLVQMFTYPLNAFMMLYFRTFSFTKHCIKYIECIWQ